MVGFICLALIVGVIWVEVQIFGYVASGVGVLVTIIGVFVTAGLGFRLMRRAFVRLPEAAARGHHARPDAVMNGLAAAVIGGVLLLIPGYGTDVVGLCCFVPGLNQLIGGWLLRQRLAGRVEGMHFYGGSFHRSDFFDNSGDSENDEHDADIPASQAVLEGKARSVDPSDDRAHNRATDMSARTSTERGYDDREENKEEDTRQDG